MSKDTTVKKIDSRYSPTGEKGQRYLASGTSVSMRLWQNKAPGQDKEEHTNPYETVGYVIEGQAKLHLDEQTVTLSEGDSWVVPAGAVHRYEIIEPFTAVEATHPPARIDGRDLKE